MFELNPFPVAFFRDFFDSLLFHHDHSTSWLTILLEATHVNGAVFIGKGHKKDIGKCSKCHKQDQIFLKMSLSFCPKITFLLIGVIWQKYGLQKTNKLEFLCCIMTISIMLPIFKTLFRKIKAPWYCSLLNFFYASIIFEIYQVSCLLFLIIVPPVPPSWSSNWRVWKCVGA